MKNWIMVKQLLDDLPYATNTIHVYRQVKSEADGIDQLNMEKADLNRAVW